MDVLKNMIHIMNRVEYDNVSLYLLFKINNKSKNLPKWEIRKMKTNTDLAKEVLSINKDFLKLIITQKSLDVIDYSPGPNNDKSIVEKSDVNYLPKFDEIHDLLKRNATELPSDSKVKYYKPIAYIMKLDTFINGTHENSIVSFQYLVQQNTLKKGRLIGRFDDTFRRMENDLFYIGPTLDALYCENKILVEPIDMYIFNKQHIDWIFGFGEIFKEKIRTVFNENKNEYDKLININDFVNFVLSDYLFERKIYKVLKNGNFDMYFNKETISKVENEANISKLEWKDEKLVVNEDNVKKILNIVNEDYLKSVVSDTVYRSLSKTSVE